MIFGIFGKFGIGIRDDFFSNKIFFIEKHCHRKKSWQNFGFFLEKNWNFENFIFQIYFSKIFFPKIFWSRKIFFETKNNSKKQSSKSQFEKWKFQMFENQNSEKIENVSTFFRSKFFRWNIFLSKSCCYVFRSQIFPRFQKSYLENSGVNSAACA